MANLPHNMKDITLNIVLEQPTDPKRPRRRSASSDEDEENSLTNAENDDYFQPHLQPNGDSPSHSPSHSTILGLRSDGTPGSPSPVRRTILMSSPLSGIRNAALNAARGKSFDGADAPRRPAASASINLGDILNDVARGPQRSARSPDALFGGIAQSAHSTLYPDDAPYDPDDRTLDDVPEYAATAAQVRQWIARQLHLRLGVEVEEARQRARSWRWLGGQGLRECGEEVFREVLGAQLGWWVWAEVQRRTRGAGRRRRGGGPLVSPDVLIHACLAVGIGFAFLAFDCTREDAAVAYMMLSALFGFLFLVFYCGYYYG